MVAFSLKSDGAVEEDGFYFDNFFIHGYSRFMKGDINQDNSINIYDLVMLIEFIFQVIQFLIICSIYQILIMIII